MDKTRNYNKQIEPEIDEILSLLAKIAATFLKSKQSKHEKLDISEKEFSEKMEIIFLRRFVNEIGENRMTHVLTSLLEDVTNLNLLTGDEVDAEKRNKYDAVVAENALKEKIALEMENRNRWDQRVQYCLKNLNNPIALNSSPLIRLAQVERIARTKYKNEGLPRAKALKDVLFLCIDRLVKEMENDSSSIKVARYLKLAKKGMNNSQIAKEMGLTREHVSRVYRNKALNLVTQEFLTTIGHYNMAAKGDYKINLLSSLTPA